MPKALKGQKVDRRLVEQALKWREQNGYTGRGGVVVIFEGKVQGWVNRLRDPYHWQPGCVAIDEEGHCWHARGGNSQNGAIVWG